MLRRSFLKLLAGVPVAGSLANDWLEREVQRQSYRDLMLRKERQAYESIIHSLEQHIWVVPEGRR